MPKVGLLVLTLLALVLPAGAHAVTVERVISAKGIEAWLVQDHTNPIIAVSFAIRGGAATDPAGKAGLAHMAAALIDEGAGELDSQAFQGELEDLAIKLSFSAGRDTFGGGLRTLTDNLDRAAELLRLALTRPRFDAEAVARIRSQVLANLARQLQDPDDIASRTWYRLQFPDHPYGAPLNGTPESIGAIGAEDLRGFVRDRLGRDKLIVGVVGDIGPERLKGLLDGIFGDLPEKAAPLAVADTRPATAGRVEVIERPIPQSVVVLGGPGIKRRDPDWYAAYLVNYILGGGGFSSRLMEEVREKRGLAYSVYSYLQPLDHAGLVVGGVATRNDRVAESLAMIRQVWRDMAENGPTEQELANAKTYLNGSFPLQLDSTGSIAGLLVSMQIDDLGIDYIDRRPALIEGVTLEQARQVARRLYDPARMTAVVVGAPQGLGQTN